MNNITPSIMGVLIGVLLIPAYVVFSIKKRSSPTLDQATNIILSCTGITVSVDFLRIIIFTPVNLGTLEEHRITMIVGAVAVVWISVDAVIKTYRNISSNADHFPLKNNLTNNQPSKPVPLEQDKQQSMQGTGHSQTQPESQSE